MQGDQNINEILIKQTIKQLPRPPLSHDGTSPIIAASKQKDSQKLQHCKRAEQPSSNKLCNQLNEDIILGQPQSVFIR